MEDKEKGDEKVVETIQEGQDKKTDLPREKEGAR